MIGSQYGEDIFLQEYFKNKPYGFLVDVGAADGEDNSNSFRLLQRPHWQGILIEPEPNQFQVLQKRYESRLGVDCVNCGVGKEEGDKVLYCAAQVSTFLPSWRDRCIEVHGLSYEEKKVKVKTLAKILEELKAPPEIDFLTIDCEGTDVEVLQSLDFSLFCPRLICMEVKGIKGVKRLSIPGYKKIHRTLGNTFYEEVG